MNTLRRVGVALLLLLLSPAATTWAASWSLEPTLEGRVSYNDNIALSPAIKDRVWSYHLSPRALFAWREQVSEVTGEARLGLNRHPSRGDLDTVDALAQLQMSKTMELHAWGLGLGVNRDSTLASEAQQTGVVQQRRQRTRKSVSPNYRRTLNERASINLRYQFADVEYERGAGLVDYREHQVSTVYTYALDERMRWDTSLAWDRLRADNRSVRTDTRSVSSGINYAWSERISLNASLGWRGTRTQLEQSALFCRFGSTLICDFLGEPLQVVTQRTTIRGSGLILSLNGDFSDETGRYQLALSRGTQPTGSGLTVRTDRLALRWERAVTERISANVALAWLRSAYDGNLAAGAKYIAFEPTLAWRLRQDLSLSAGISHTRARTDGVQAVARANALSLTLIYQWAPVALR